MENIDGVKTRQKPFLGQKAAPNNVGSVPSGEQEHKIRITITSKNCSAIERISNELVKAARDKNLKVKVNYPS